MGYRNLNTVKELGKSVRSEFEVVMKEDEFQLYAKFLVTNKAEERKHVSFLFYKHFIVHLHLYLFEMQAFQGNCYEKLLMDSQELRRRCQKDQRVVGRFMRKTKLLLIASLNSGEIRPKKQGDNEIKKM